MGHLFREGRTTHQGESVAALGSHAEHLRAGDPNSFLSKFLNYHTVLTLEVPPFRISKTE